MANMTYLDSQPSGPRKYEGDVAIGYNAKRENSQKWIEEQEILESLIETLSDQCDSFLDIPTGTGRLLPKLQECGYIGTAADVSKDMIAEAEKTVTGNDNIVFTLANATNLSVFDDDHFDVSFMIRLTRWLSPIERKQALQELQRVSKKYVVFTARTDPRHPHAFLEHDIEDCIGQGWGAMAASQHLPSDPHYWVIVLGRD